MQIGLISDTHGWLDPQVYNYFEACNEIWHAGDIGGLEVIQQLEAYKPVRAVYGNIDGKEIKAIYPPHQFFTCEGMRVWIMHIAGRPPRYTPEVLASLQQDTPDILVCGHSHILQVMHDRQHTPLLYINPGAAGRHGIHHVRTILRFTIHMGKITHMEAIELGLRGSLTH
jgi:putative phosphoesterase